MVSGFICGSQSAPVPLPPAGDGECCPGAILDGPEHCTCWEPVYSAPQEAAKAGPSNVQPRPCGDCAFRSDSPERSGDESYEGDWDELEHLAATGRPFFCHSGMRHRAAWRHPSGAEVPGHPGDYDPSIVNGIPRKADGSPADLCGGWHARVQHWQRVRAREAGAS